ncbi:co-chaperone YbbN [Streptomyces rimosus]|uniref:thioredoxin family protein n=1 Tax=Streptomyces rimosus TaxID=1927 RepID=UPI00067AE7BC|nr:thioredoxin family protein [Streptomyces rimosus]
MYRKLAVVTAAVATLLSGTATAAIAAPVAPVTEAAAPAADIPAVVDVTDANYDQVMQWSKTKPVVLDFTASWCYWCQKQKPYLQQYNTQDKGAWVWAKVDVDENPGLSQKYNVRGIPALLNIRNGREAGSRLVGFDGPSSLRNWLNRL